MHTGNCNKIAKKLVKSLNTSCHNFRCGELDDPVFLHSSSVLRATKPQWIVYQEVIESKGKMYLRGVTAIEPEWIPIFCKTLCKLENPLRYPPPFYNEEKENVYCSVKATYGKQGMENENILKLIKPYIF